MISFRWSLRNNFKPLIIILHLSRVIPAVCKYFWVRFFSSCTYITSEWEKSQNDTKKIHTVFSKYLAVVPVSTFLSGLSMSPGLQLPFQVVYYMVSQHHGVYCTLSSLRKFLTIRSIFHFSTYFPLMCWPWLWKEAKVFLYSSKESNTCRIISKRVHSAEVQRGVSTRYKGFGVELFFFCTPPWIPDITAPLSYPWLWQSWMSSPYFSKLLNIFFVEALTVLPAIGMNLKKDSLAWTSPSTWPQISYHFQHLVSMRNIRHTYYQKEFHNILHFYHQPIPISFLTWFSRREITHFVSVVVNQNLLSCHCEKKLHA